MVLTVLSSDVYATRKASSLFPVVLAAQSCANTLAAAQHRAPAQLLDMLSAALAGAVEAEVHHIDCRELFISPVLCDVLVQVVAPLCREIETELRLAVHKQAGLQLDERNPFRTAPVELRPFLDSPPLAILGTRLR